MTLRLVFVCVEGTRMRLDEISTPLLERKKRLNAFLAGSLID